MEDFMTNKEIFEIRRMLLKLLRVCPENKNINLKINAGTLKTILCDYDKNNEEYKFFADFDLLKKIDLTGFDFTGVMVMGLDFHGSKGVKINPQTVWCKFLCFGNFHNVQFIGPFDGACIHHANFSGSKGAVIPLREIKYNNITGCIFDNNVTLIQIDNKKDEENESEKIIKQINQMQKKIKKKNGK